MQGHFGNSLTAPNDLMALLDRYAKFQKEIAVTEFPNPGRPSVVLLHGITDDGLCWGRVAGSLTA